jgi:prevent-host-death family protein
LSLRVQRKTMVRRAGLRNIQRFTDGERKRDLRQSLKRDRLQLMKAILAEPEIVTRKGKPVSVIIPIKDYEELMERVEDAEDVAWLKRARKTPLQYRPLEDYLAGRNRK